MARHRWAWALCAAILSLPATGCQQAPPAPGFALTYEEPDAADRDARRFLRDGRIAESALAELNAYVDLPHRVAVVARSCRGEGTGYDPDTRRIELCYDDLAEERALFDPAGGVGDGQAAELVRETLHHEAGHALVDALRLPVDGDRAEEASADDFARLVLLRAGPAGEAALLTAARAYDLEAAADPVPAPADEHAPAADRARGHRCAVHVEAPQRHPELATPDRADCAGAWRAARDGWIRALAPLLR
ncbi:DUF4344 domain-containing metallopeptidase [Streptomyces sp. NPDC087917]|uniref:DUF4344 domain-containing metallopeptidase n=1 Tax=Streptomyces sp. NPDC087917 TaxID=3155060 RepID=UPI00343068B7